MLLAKSTCSDGKASAANASSFVEGDKLSDKSLLKESTLVCQHLELIWGEVSHWEVDVLVGVLSIDWGEPFGSCLEIILPRLMIRAVSPDALRLCNSMWSCLFFALYWGVKSCEMKMFLCVLLLCRFLAFLKICLLIELSLREISKRLGLLACFPKQKHLVVSKLVMLNSERTSSCKLFKSAEWCAAPVGADVSYTIRFDLRLSRSMYSSIHSKKWFLTIRRVVWQ